MYLRIVTSDHTVEVGHAQQIDYPDDRFRRAVRAVERADERKPG